MRKSRVTEEQVIKVLKEHAAGLSAGKVYRKYGISDATFYKWRSRYGGMEVSDAAALSISTGSRSISRSRISTSRSASIRATPSATTIVGPLGARRTTACGRGRTSPSPRSSIRRLSSSCATGRVLRL